jgi:hypothetical protein
VTPAKNEIAGYTNQRCRAKTYSSDFAGSNVVLAAIVPIVIFSLRAKGGHQNYQTGQ